MNFTFKHTKLACFGGYMTSAIASNFPPILFIIFQNELGLSIGSLGALISLNFGVQMITDIVGANYVDKIGYRICAVAANLLVAFGVIFMGLLPLCMSAKFTALTIATVTYAIGSGLLEVLVSPIMEAIPSDKKSANMSFLHSFYCWGQFISILITTLFVAFSGGRDWWILCLFWSLIPFATALLFSKVPINHLPHEKNSSSFGIFKNKLFLVFLLLMTSSGISEIAVSQWASLFVETALGVSKITGDILGPCMFALLMGSSRIIYAKFSTKINLANYIMLCGVLCTFAYIIMAFVPNNYISLAMIGIIGFSVAMMWPGVLSLASEKFPLGGTALFAYLAIFGDIGCTTGPLLTAVVAEKFTLNGSGLRAGIAACLIFPALVAVLTFITKKMRSFNEK